MFITRFWSTTALSIRCASSCRAAARSKVRRWRTSTRNASASTVWWRNEDRRGSRPPADDNQRSESPTTEDETRKAIRPRSSHCPCADLRCLSHRLAVERQPLLAGRHPHGLAVLDGTGEHHLGERILQIFLDRPLERSRPVGRVGAFVSQP